MIPARRRKKTRGDSTAGSTVPNSGTTDRCCFGFIVSCRHAWMLDCLLCRGADTDPSHLMQLSHRLS
jgi:hypothetical protein